MSDKEWIKKLELRVSINEENHSRWIQMETAEVRKLLTEVAVECTAPAPQLESFGDWCDMKGIEPTMGQVDAFVREQVRAATPQVAPTPVQGSWPKNCPQRIFVEGASWWQFHSYGSTLFARERDEAEAEAVKRFGPVEGTSEQAPQEREKP